MIKNGKACEKLEAENQFYLKMTKYGMEIKFVDLWRHNPPLTDQNNTHSWCAI